MIHIGDYVLTKSGSVVKVIGYNSYCIVNENGDFYTFDFIEKVTHGSNRLQDYEYVEATPSYVDDDYYFTVSSDFYQVTNGTTSYTIPNTSIESSRNYYDDYYSTWSFATIGDEGE